MWDAEIHSLLAVDTASGRVRLLARGGDFGTPSHIVVSPLQFVIVVDGETGGVFWVQDNGREQQQFHSTRVFSNIRRFASAAFLWRNLKPATHVADLGSADLRAADLREAKLSHANLEHAKVTPEQLAEAATLEGAPGPSLDWQPRYFAGLDNAGLPVWTDDQIFATPVIANEELEDVLEGISEVAAA